MGFRMKKNIRKIKYIKKYIKYKKMKIIFNVKIFNLYLKIIINICTYV